MIERAGHAHLVRARCEQHESHEHTLRRGRDDGHSSFHDGPRRREEQDERRGRGQRRTQGPEAIAHADLTRRDEPVPPASCAAGWM